MRLLSLCLLTVIAAVPTIARSDEPDPATDAALAKTQAVLKDPAQRRATIRSDPAAKDADSKVQGVAKTDAESQAIYELSADVMKTLTDLAGGDPNKMMKILEEAKANPEKFAEQFTPEQRAQLEQIAKQIEDAQSGAKQPASTPPAKQ